MSFQRSWCQSGHSTCSNQMFEVSPFCAYRFMQWITTLIHCLLCFDQNDATLQSVVLSDGRRHRSGSGRLVPAECPKLHSSPDWDLDGSVAKPAGCCSRDVSDDSTATVSRARWAGGTVLLECEEVTDDVSEEEVSRIGNWDLWQQFEKKLKIS